MAQNINEVEVSPELTDNDYLIGSVDNKLRRVPKSFFAKLLPDGVNEKFSVLESRMDTFTSLPEGSTSGDAELQDIRVGVGGVIYDNAGTAVREQILKVSEDVQTDISCIYVTEYETTPELVDGFVRYADGTISDESFENHYKRTDYIYVPIACETITHNFSLSDDGVDGIAFYDSTKTFISGCRTMGTITEIPVGTKYVIFSYYDFSIAHDVKPVTFTIKDITKPKCNIQKLVTFGDSHVARGLWQPSVLSYYGITNHVNLGVGGSTVSINNSATVAPFVDNDRIEQIKSENPDTIIIIGGTNDVHLETPLGSVDELLKTVSDKDQETFYGAYGFLIESLLTWKPTLQIILCTIPQGFYDNIHTVKYSEISKAIKEIASHYSLPVADIFAECGINKVNLGTYSDDLIHYNELGNARVSSVIINTINRSYLSNN